MLDPALLLKLLVLLGIANGAPIFATKLFKRHLAVPLDGGIELPDGRPLFGPSKTIRGITASVICTTLAAPLLSFDWTSGAMLASASMAGDLGSSFLKRRIGLQVHAQAIVLDHIPEVLFPLLLLRTRLGLGWLEIALLLVSSILLGAALSRLLFKLRIREQPY